MSAQIEMHELPFAAPIPAGHSVLIARLRPSEEIAPLGLLALDATSSTVYCGAALIGPLSSGHLSATTDPVGVLTTRWSWRLVKLTKGRVMGALVGTSFDGDHRMEVVTKLYV